MIPSHKWLQENGQSALSRRIREKPELFAHLEQEGELPQSWLSRPVVCTDTRRPNPANAGG
jgi:hypothetical protein